MSSLVGIVDDSGKVVSGLLRSKTGAIIVNDSVALNKHRAAKSMENRLAATERKIDEIHESLNTIMQLLQQGK